MVRIAISVEAFEAIARTPLGSVGYENKVNERGERLIWLDRAVVDRLRAMRGPGQSYSDVILRIAGGGPALRVAALTREILSGQYFGSLGPREAVWKRNRYCQHFGEPV